MVIVTSQSYYTSSNRNERKLILGGDRVYGQQSTDWATTTIENEDLDDRGVLRKFSIGSYKEVLVQVPGLRTDFGDPFGYSSVKTLRGFTDADKDLSNHFLEDAVEERGFTLSDTAVHYRTTDYEINDEKYLLIQEIQSDFFQNIQKSYGDTKEYKEFTEKTPYSGTNHWVALAFRHALDDVVKEGDYKGIAWLDGRMQTRLEHGYDPGIITKVTAQGFGMYFFMPSEITYDPIGESLVTMANLKTKGGIELNYPINKEQVDMLDKGGWGARLMGHQDDLNIFNISIDGKDIKVVDGEDYIKFRPMVNSEYVFVTFRKGLFNDSNYDQAGRLKHNIIFSADEPNPFALFQDKIVTGAISKQMKRNGIDVDIKHDKDLQMHVMELSEASQNKLRAQGQPIYSKAIPSPIEGEFKPLPKAESPIPTPATWNKNAPENDDRLRNSVAVHKNGKPITLYHGSSDIRDIRGTGEFRGSLQRFGEELTLGDADLVSENKAFFFVDSIRVARTYADEMREFDYANAVPGIVKSYLVLRNPLIVEADGAQWRNFVTSINGYEVTGTREVVKLAQRLGYDGIVIRNVRDPYTFKGAGGKLPAADVYVAFSATQIINAETGETMSPIGSQGLSPKAQRLLAMQDNIARTQELIDENIKLQATRDAINATIAATPVTPKQEVVVVDKFTDNFVTEFFNNYAANDPVTIFSKQNDVEEFAKRILGRDGEYKSVTVTALTYETFSVIGSSGKQLSEIDRKIKLDKRGNVSSVYHRSVSIRSTYQGQGVAGKLLLDSMEEYNRLGVKKVLLTAVSIGSYAWARYGFIPVYRDSFDKTVGPVINRFDFSEFTSSKKRANKIRTELQGILKTASTETVVQQIASYMYRSHKVGKEILLDSDWHAEFRLANPYQTSFFNMYVNKEVIEAELSKARDKVLFDSSELTFREKKVLGLWTREDSSNWRRIYKQAESDPNVLINADARFKLFDSIFTKYSPDYVGTVYRVLREEQDFEVGALISDVAPASVSRSIRGIKRFSKSLDNEITTLLTIKKSKKPVGYQIDNVSTYKEEEILIPPRSVFRVVEINRAKDFNRKNMHNVTEFVLEVVEDANVDRLALRTARLVSARLDFEKREGVRSY